MYNSQENLDHRLSGEKPNFWLEINFPSVKETYVVAMECLSPAIKCQGEIKNYDLDLQKYYHNVLSAVGEALFNAEARGNNRDPNKKVYVKLSFFKDFFVVGVKDEGCFYKNNNVKKFVENKQKLPVDLAPPFSDSSGNGMDIIYEFSDKIFVDSNNGILYLLFDYYRKRICSKGG